MYCFVVVFSLQFKQLQRVVTMALNPFTVYAKFKNWTLFFSVRSQNHSYKNSIVLRLARHLCSSTSLVMCTRVATLFTWTLIYSRSIAISSRDQIASVFFFTNCIPPLPSIFLLYRTGTALAVAPTQLGHTWPATQSTQSNFPWRLIYYTFQVLLRHFCEVAISSTCFYMHFHLEFSHLLYY